MEIADFVNDIDDQKVINSDEKKLKEFEDNAIELIVSTCQYYPINQNTAYTTTEEEEFFEQQKGRYNNGLYKLTVSVIVLLIVYLLIRRYYTKPLAR
jgi:hypothetical protein